MPSATPRTVHILVLNPNSSKAMTDGMAQAIQKLPLADTVGMYLPQLTLTQTQHIKLSYYTASDASPASINNDADIRASTAAVMADHPQIEKIRSRSYDAVLVACFSVHTLVTELSRFHLPVMGIFEASVLASLSILSDPLSPLKWGIVTTGKFWEDHLRHGARMFLGQSEGRRDGEGESSGRLAGVFSTGLNAGDFHTVPPEEVKIKLKTATRELLGRGHVRCVVMGCGGMAGLEAIIRETAEEVYGEQRAAQLFVIDGVKAGVLQLDQVVQSRRAFGQ